MHYVLFFKPYGVLSQFTREAGHKSLGDFGPFPPGVYPVGRLDLDSEGLLLLTDDNQLKHRLTEPGYGHTRTYLVQVERVPDNRAIAALQTGVRIHGKQTKPAEVRLLTTPPDLPPRAVPVRFRKNVPVAWLEITLREGRNRQIRRMTAATGHPTLRLVRIRMACLSLGGLEPGGHRVLGTREIRNLLKTAGLVT
jgi:23S rRNA pseudouridine2457 synthase